jgi:hypothetical protein
MTSALIIEVVLVVLVVTRISHFFILIVASGVILVESVSMLRYHHGTCRLTGSYLMN